MRQTYRIRPEVIDRARERLGCTSDEKLAVRLGMTAATIGRVRRGESPSLGTTIALLNAAAVDLPVGVEAA
ncbi:helix-turn-helix domain-containing protein [Corynebacterium sp.]|uniref:helix-turn-helix domain-containing protein n=1 Tax=Corynebacterium sp. TaxID=1720 RepID=UPI003B3A2D4E